MGKLESVLRYFQSTCKPAVAGMPPLRWAQLTANVACAAAEAFIMSRANEKEGDAMVLAVQAYYDGKLPGIEGINRWLGGKTYSIWRDKLGHLGPGFERLEGYVFYATIYKRSPALIKGEIPFKPIVDRNLG